MNTAEHLRAARAELARGENFSGSNPDKYRADINLAPATVQTIDADLNARRQMSQRVGTGGGSA